MATVGDSVAPAARAGDAHDSDHVLDHVKQCLANGEVEAALTYARRLDPVITQWMRAADWLPCADKVDVLNDALAARLRFQSLHKLPGVRRERVRQEVLQNIVGEYVRHPPPEWHAFLADAQLLAAATAPGNIWRAVLLGYATQYWAEALTERADASDEMLSTTLRGTECARHGSPWPDGIPRHWSSLARLAAAWQHMRTRQRAGHDATPTAWHQALQCLSDAVAVDPSASYHPYLPQWLEALRDAAVQHRVSLAEQNLQPLTPIYDCMARCCQREPAERLYRVLVQLPHGLVPACTPIHTAASLLMRWAGDGERIPPALASRLLYELKALLARRNGNEDRSALYRQVASWTQYQLRIRPPVTGDAFECPRDAVPFLALLHLCWRRLGPSAPVDVRFFANHPELVPEFPAATVQALKHIEVQR
ncbi:hypothetical protein CDCA_CDCA05G1473 [Cyanidium caldarium]|uniref:Uncharacterized protein n=1 Tax=Cyanidium caldarium TaxID=2771 RepID=A0AAV9ITP3_CYACA|nr:hypothetical protein CDCA_CDCA05G1473 [Cyanidium caldarium]|eukprot:ctg_1213.g378